MPFAMRKLSITFLPILLLLEEPPSISMVCLPFFIRNESPCPTSIAVTYNLSVSLYRRILVLSTTTTENTILMTAILPRLMLRGLSMHKIAAARIR